MIPPIYPIVTGSAAVTALIGTRFYGGGAAPDSPATPYATWQVVAGVPLNYVEGAPGMDTFRAQVDAWGATEPQARAVAIAIRDAIEAANNGQIVSWNGHERDADTKLYRYSFDVQFWTPR